MNRTDLAVELFGRLNAARADPAGYGRGIGLDLSWLPPRPPFQWDDRLAACAYAHSQDENDRHYVGHYSSDGKGYAQRMQEAGFASTSYGESLAWGIPSAADTLKALILDITEAPGYGHRVHLLGLDPYFLEENACGVGVYQSLSDSYHIYWTCDTAMGVAIPGHPPGPPGPPLPPPAPPPATAGLGIFAPPTATWKLQAIPPFAFGWNGAAPISGDWDGDGVTGIGLFDPVGMWGRPPATWYLKNRAGPGGPDYPPFAFGQRGDLPVVGKWDGGKADRIGVFRPSTATWYLNLPSGVQKVAYGGAGDLPISGGWR